MEASSTDYGKDLASTEQLLKAHAALAVAMGMHEEPINNAVKDAQNSGHVRFPPSPCAHTGRSWMPHWTAVETLTDPCVHPFMVLFSGALVPHALPHL